MLKQIMKRVVSFQVAEKYFKRLLTLFDKLMVDC